MLRAACCVLAVAALLSGVAAMADGLLANGDFELPDEPGQANAAQWRAGAGTIKATDEEPFSGARCGVVDHPSADASTWVTHADMPLPGPGLYVFSAAVRNPDGATVFPQLSYLADESGARAKLQSWGQPFR
ncbi:MAG TPA: hypothetical protein VM283_03360 [Armatimonadota bacterium]|nr:hypothetical protein [Armatimonadota bacterium]